MLALPFGDSIIRYGKRGEARSPRMQTGTGFCPSIIVFGQLGNVPFLSFLFSDELAKIVAS
jgi:hypothetical protein